MPMNMSVSRLDLQGPIVIDPDCFEDERGFFYESYSRARFEQHGLQIEFVQDNHSRSRRDVIRGFHFQDATASQWRLVRCTVGKVWDVIVDLRSASNTFGRWVGVELTAESRRQLLVPPEFAHGFCVLSDVAEVQYKCSNRHSPQAERALAWNDPEVAVQWPTSSPLLSARDRENGASLDSYRQRPVF